MIHSHLLLASNSARGSIKEASLTLASCENPFAMEYLLSTIDRVCSIICRPARQPPRCDTEALRQVGRQAGTGEEGNRQGTHDWHQVGRQGEPLSQCSFLATGKTSKTAS